MHFELNQELLEYTVEARNFADPVHNLLHQEEIAQRFGYRGEVVPGVGVYAYMTAPITESFGVDWLERGSMSAKFLKPIYDGDTVTVRSKVIHLDPVRILVSVYNQCDVMCALGEASLPEDHTESLSILNFPLHPMPLESERLKPMKSEIPNDCPLGTMEFTIDLSSPEGEHATFLNEIDAKQSLYRGEHPHYHPAQILLKANQVLYKNLNIDPWIHIASDVRYHALPMDGDPVALRGRIRHTYAKQGHLIALSELTLVGRQEKFLTHLTHTTIIQPAWAPE
jgi:hypothetical protein